MLKSAVSEPGSGHVISPASNYHTPPRASWLLAPPSPHHIRRSMAHSASARLAQVEDISPEGDGWAPLGRLKETILARRPDFDTRSYGFRKFR